MAAGERECWIPMNDGVRLDASVFSPDGRAPEEGWPALVLVHGHGEDASKKSVLDRAQRDAERGYLAIAYSVRGQGSSEGLSFHLGPREIFDLQDVVHWVLRELPAHPRKLAVCGSSQGGWHAYMAAIHCPQVATVVPENIFTDYAEFAVWQGCLSRWFMTRTMRRRVLSAGLQEMMRQWALAGEWERMREWLKPCSPLLFAGRIRCPVFILHGWHDAGMPPNQAIALFQRLQVPRKLYLGGGGHDGQDEEKEKLHRQELVDRWLDHWLRGEENGIVQERVVYVRRPGWQRVYTADFPPAGVEQLDLYLHQGGTLSPEPPTAASLPSNINNVPLDPDYGLQQALYDDMAGVEGALAREVVAFESAPFDRDLEVAGAPCCRFRVIPSEPFFQIHAELYCTGEGGERLLISRGHWAIRAAVPGRHLEIDFELSAIAFALAAGQRLRLEVSNYNTTYAFPFFAPYRGRLLHEGRHPSALSVPVRPG